MALQEIAACLDEHVDIFKKSSQFEVEKFQTASQALIEQQKQSQSRFQDEINRLHREREQVFDEYQQFHKTLETRFVNLSCAIQASVEEARVRAESSTARLEKQLRNTKRNLSLTLLVIGVLAAAFVIWILSH